MSRFFSQTGQESDSSSSSEDSDSEREEEKEEAPAPEDKPAVSAKTNAFMKGPGDADSDSDDEGKRVVRSHKDKKWDQMTTCVDKMKNDMKINDWNAISADFDLLHKLMEKAKQIIAREGIPQFYFKALLNLDDFLQKTLADKPVHTPNHHSPAQTPAHRHRVGWVMRNLCCLPMERCDGIKWSFMSDDRVHACHPAHAAARRLHLPALPHSSPHAPSLAATPPLTLPPSRARVPRRPSRRCPRPTPSRSTA